MLFGVMAYKKLKNNENILMLSKINEGSWRLKPISLTIAFRDGYINESECWRFRDWHSQNYMQNQQVIIMNVIKLTFKLFLLCSIAHNPKWTILLSFIFGSSIFPAIFLPFLHSSFCIRCQYYGQLMALSVQDLIELAQQSLKYKLNQTNINENDGLACQKYKKKVHRHSQHGLQNKHQQKIVEQYGIIQESGCFKSQRQSQVIINKLFKQISKNLDMRPNKFIVKLLEMMKEFPEIINWSASGAQLEIRDIGRFSLEVHPRYFTTSNYQSFLRQLNMYGFKKITKTKNTVSFTHSQFRQHNHQRFHHIKRKQQITQERQSESFLSRSKSEIEQKQTSFPSVVCLMNQELRSTLTLIKKQTTEKGAVLVERLQKILQKSREISGRSVVGKAGQSSSVQHFRQCVSFCRLEEVMMHRGQSQGYEFNFQSGNLNHSLYFDD